MTDKPTDKPLVKIYTDGGADPNPGPGGWGAVLIFERNGEVITKELNGGETATTNNRMELTAAIYALRALKKPCVVELHTDSSYLKNGITKWMPKWLENNFNKGKIENVDLWQTLNSEVARHDIRWHWVKGHAGDQYNERADQLATAAMPGRSDESDFSIPRAYLRVSCVKGSGSWAAVLRWPNGDQIGEMILADGKRNTTPNELDLLAASAAIEAFPEGAPIQLFTASSYLYTGIKQWVPAWKQTNWVKKDGKEVQHRDLWARLDALDQRHRVVWVMVKDEARPIEYEQVEAVLEQAVKDKRP
ncbi:MAG: ribonuclease HI [Anaerolineae bacterium]|nr:ribonuclease HI [Anaerolineae bacterium]